MSSSADELKTGFCFAFLGGGLVLQGLKQSAARREVEDFPKSRIHSAAQGWNEVQGYALSFGDVVEGITRERLAFYRCEIQKYVRSGNRGSWVTQYVDRSKMSFVIADETGFALVMADDCEEYVTENITKLSDLTSEQRDRADLKYRGQVRDWPEAETWGKGSWRLVEKYLSVGSPVLVQGDFRSASSEQFASIPARDIAGFYDLIKLAQDRGRFLKLLDTDQNGKIDDRELRHGTGIFFRTTGKQNLPATGDFIVALVGILGGDSERKLTVIDTHQAHFIERMRYAILKTILGIILLTAGIGIVYTRVYARFRP